ncbi:MAG: DUF4368 domain-containing protein [Oscillospiraceae bacterium]
MDMEDFLAIVRRYTHVTKITRRMVSELIDHIDVYHAERVGWRDQSAGGYPL